MKPASLVAGWLALAGAAHAVALLAPGDFIIAVNPKASTPNSSYPAAEDPPKAIDGAAPVSSNKYLNFGGHGTGFIATPTAPAIMQSFTITTGGDAPGRDPARYEIWGTNDAVVSANNSNGLGGESWALVATGGLSLPSDRNTVSAPVSFANGTAYAAYKVVFPTLKDADRMQIGEFTGFTGSGGTGSSVFTAGNPILAIDAPVSASRYPGAESPANLINGAPQQKYLNFGGAQSGFIVTPSYGASIVGSMQLTTANDSASFPGRNPTSFEIYGTNQSIVSHDNSFGDMESWTLISSGPVSLPAENFAEGDLITFSNSTAYTSYKVIFPTLQDPNSILQIGEIQLFAVPEPGTAMLSGVALLGLGLRRRR